MAKKVSLSFHYNGDVTRCQQVRNIGAHRGGPRGGHCPEVGDHQGGR